MPGNRTAKFQIRSFWWKGERSQVPCPLLRARAGVQQRSKRELFIILQRSHSGYNSGAPKPGAMARPRILPCLAHDCSASQGAAGIWGLFWVPESEENHSWGKILMWKACVEDLALILYNTENTCNAWSILYDPPKIFLLQLWATVLERYAWGAQFTWATTIFLSLLLLLH